MTLTGHVLNGVIVLDTGSLPEGATVRIVSEAAPAEPPLFPRVRRSSSNTYFASNDQIAALMHAEEASS